MTSATTAMFLTYLENAKRPTKLKKANTTWILEHFDQAFKKQRTFAKPFDQSRKEFEAKIPEVKNDSGRAFWRLREINDCVTALTDQLKALPDDKVKEKQALQERWLTYMGEMGHYFGDLAMPLHNTENHDGQKTGQKGIHSHYEDDVVE